jgi:hypothetical protein
MLRKWWPILLLAAGIPPIAHGMLALEISTSGFAQWLPDSQAAKRDYDWFVDRFGRDDFLLVSWNNCTLDDERLVRLASALNAQGGSEGLNHSKHLIQRVITGPGVLGQLQAAPLNLSREVALERLEGVFVGPDHRQTCAFVQPTDLGASNQRDVIELIRRTAALECGLSPEALKLGGSVYEAVEIGAETGRAVRDFVIPVFTLSVVLALLSLRSIRLTLIVLACAGYCRCLSLALVHYSGGYLSAVLIVMPALVYVLSISAAVHLVNYYRDAVREGGLAGAAYRALRVGWLPCTLAAGTTAIGLFSLCVSDIPPVRTFGVFSAVSLLISTVILFLFLPRALEIWPDQSARPVDGGQRPPQAAGRRQSLVHRGADLIIRHERWISATSVVMVAVFAAGILRIETTVKLERMFSPQSAMIQNYRWIEERIGPLVSVEVIPRFGENCSLDLTERIELIAEIEQALRMLPEVGGVISPATFVPNIPKQVSLRDAVKRKIFAKKATAQRERMIEEGFLRIGRGTEHWRISARVPAIRDVNYEEFISRVRHRIDRVLDSPEHAGAKGITVTYTGLIPMIDRAQRRLLDDLVNSFLLAAVLICPVMMVIVRGFWSGLLAMIPNTVPAVIVFGGLGWLGIPVDVGAILTASVALGIAVDDTLHVLTWYSRGIRAGLERAEAIRNAYDRCALAMIQTTLICGLGLLVLANSSFVPTSRFAWLILVLLVAALIGDLVLLPAILAGPLGRLFATASRRDADEEQTDVLRA